MADHVKDFGAFPTWDAHHHLVSRRSEISDERWSAILAQPDWNDHAREELQAERICDRCLINVAQDIVNTGGPEAQQEAQEELARRGIDWESGRAHFLNLEQRQSLLIQQMPQASYTVSGFYDSAWFPASMSRENVRVTVMWPKNRWQAWKAANATDWWMAWFVRLRPVRYAERAAFSGRMEVGEDGVFTVSGEERA